MIARAFFILITCVGSAVNSHALGDELSEASMPLRSTERPLVLADVMESVTKLYPPLLAALIERDIANGRLRSAQGNFDFNWFAKAVGTPSGFYESGTVETGFEQFTGLWGSTLFGSYRLTDGDRLPDYYRSERTQNGGELQLGIEIPLLRNGRIDKRRAAVLKARYDSELADQFIRRQEIDFMQTATSAYFKWLAAGTKLRLANEQLNLARNRIDILRIQVESGLIKKIVITDNRRLVVDREIQTIRARRSFEAAALTLSLFHRDENMDPLISKVDRLPQTFPEVLAPESLDMANDIRLALELRPELKQIAIELAKVGVDVEQAKNAMSPFLDVSAFGEQSLGADTYEDIEDFELKAQLELRMPLQRREAKGDRDVAESKMQQLLWKTQFARERITTEIRNAYLALVAAYEQISMTKINVELAEELENAEKELFNQGASDFLAVQLRERSTFDARIKWVEAVETFFMSLAAYKAASMQI